MQMCPIRHIRAAIAPHLRNKAESHAFPNPSRPVARVHWAGRDECVTAYEVFPTMRNFLAAAAFAALPFAVPAAQAQDTTTTSADANVEAGRAPDGSRGFGIASAILSRRCYAY